MTSYLVRFGTMRFLGVFDAPGDKAYARMAEVIVRTARGLEVGTVLCEATESMLARFREDDGGNILRAVTSDDKRDIHGIHSQEQEEFKTCEEIVRRLGLEMDLVMVEHIFGGERIVVYYLAEGRVDFRELVKILAAEFQTRIEMRQIGVRDEAKLLADYGDCGKAVCCNTHLVQMPPVSMKMAKLQKATLDPTKISGRCGRLKCCLRFEYDTYREIQEALPPVGLRVQTAEGPARIIGQEILSEQLLVELEDRTRKLAPAAEVTPLEDVAASPGEGRRRPRIQASGDEQPD